MRAVKHFIRGYEQSMGERHVNLRRHINSHIKGGGNVPSAQTRADTPQEIQAAQDIVNGLKEYSKTFNDHNEKKKKELQTLKALLLLPSDKGLPMHAKYGCKWNDSQV
jgi:hypothetical protein